MSHQFQFSGRIAIELRSHLTHPCFGRFDCHISNARFPFIGEVFAQNGYRPLLDGFGNELVTVGLGSRDGHEQLSCLNTAGINVYALDVYFYITDDVQYFDIL